MHNKNGLLRVCWDDVSRQVADVEPVFASIVNELCPDSSFPLYLAYYPYGDLKGDIHSTFLPDNNGGYFRLTDPDAPKCILKDLGYGRSSAPLAMLLEKNMELFIDLKDEKITIPRMLYAPGAIFPLARILGKNNSRVYAPNGVLTLTSGARSTFLLPNIGCAVNHSNLQRDFNVQSPPPKSLYEHWHVFKEIINSSVVNCDWKSCLLYFSQPWLNSIHNDAAWLKLKLYLHEIAWVNYEYARNNFYYDIVFSIIQKKRNLKPNPYLVDTAKHLFTTAIGTSPGYAPAFNSEALPADVLQKTYIESYGLRKYCPTILQPKHFRYESENNPIYYSLHHPSTHVFSPKSRKISSTLSEMRELEHIMKIFIQELAKNESMCSDTIISEIARNVEFGYYHNKNDRHRVIHPSSNISVIDNRFSRLISQEQLSDSIFASDAPFVRGCISIRKNSSIRMS